MQNIISSNTDAMSDDIRALAQDFLIAKKGFLNTGFGGFNSHQKYQYAKIEDIYNAVEESLAKNNIIIWHFARPEGGLEYLHTRLVHTPTGQFIEDRRVLESEKTGNQAKGSATTYMKKYGVLCLCAIATEDDDGEEEEKCIKEREENPCMSPDQVKQIESLINSYSNKNALRSNILKLGKVAYIDSLEAAFFDSVKKYIETNGK